MKIKNFREYWVNYLVRFFFNLEIEVEIRFQIINQFFMKRKISTPFLSGDFFSNIADYVVDSEDFETLRAMTSKVIFIKGDFLEYQLDKNIETLANKIVISGNSDVNFPESPRNSKQLRHLFCQNLVHNGAKNCTTIPIGLENIQLGGSGLKRFHRYQNKFAIVDRVLVPPMGLSNEVRADVLSKLKDRDLSRNFHIFQKRLSRRRYFSLTKKYRFILVLEGNGYDTHRLWEVLYQGSIPVVFDSEWIRQLNYMDLPLLRINNLNDINTSILMEFHKKYLEFSPITCDYLWSSYWERYIRSKM